MKILFCTLNWGLGHASRDVPLIKKYRAQGHEVHLAASGLSLNFWRQEFPRLETHHLPAHGVRYSSGSFQAFHLAAQVPVFAIHYVRMRLWTMRMQRKHQFDLIISDNVFGVLHRRARSVYITHQVMPVMPAGLGLAETAAHRFHKQLIESYAECWIPDNAHVQQRVGGQLSCSKQLSVPVRYLGMLSRYAGLPYLPPPRTFDIVAIVSGPEPQRSIFERLLRNLLAKSHYSALLICGKPGNENKYQTPDNIEMVNHIAAGELLAYLKNCRLCILRSGYTGIMDMLTLKQKALLVPTPGQSEQEYLATLPLIQQYFRVVAQNDLPALDLSQVIDQMPGFDIKHMDT